MENIWFNADGEVIDLEEEVARRIRELKEKERKQRLAWKAEQEQKKERAKNNFFNNDLSAIELLQKHLTRTQRGQYIILCCYLDYEGKLVYYNKGNKPLTKKDIEEILNCTRMGVYNLLKACSEGNIIRYNEEVGAYYVNPNISFRGGYRGMDRDVVSMKLQMKNLLGELTATQIGLLFDLQEFISIDYDVLCHNPEEKNWNKVRVLTPKTLAEKLEMNPQKLNRELSKLKVGATMIIQKIGYGKRCIYFVNPNYIFRGNLQKVIRAIREQYNNKTIKTIFSDNFNENDI